MCIRDRLLFGNVGGVLDHLEGAAVFIEDGVVAGLQPDVAAIPANAAITARVVRTLAQFVPEGEVLGGFPILGHHEHAVMLPQHLSLIHIFMLPPRRDPIAPRLMIPNPQHPLLRALPRRRSFAALMAGLLLALCLAPAFAAPPSSPAETDAMLALSLIHI